ncbi:VWFA and cache domain-containing protein 1-like [Glandiceps talaboti]
MVVQNIIITTTWLSLFILSESAILDVNIFADKLDNLANEGLGVSEMQKHFDRLDFASRPIDGTTMINRLSTELSAKFKARLDALKNLQTSVQDSYASDIEGTFPECCSVTGLEYDSRFGIEIDVDDACERISPSVGEKEVKKLSEPVLDVMKTNFQQNPSLKWQYFGSEEGVFTVYPAHAMHSCDSYDNRFRPWYVETATPDPKNVVIVIDRSGSMDEDYEGRTLMHIAKDAATSVLGTMNPSDKVGIVMFSDAIVVPPGTSTTSNCYAKELAAANSVNIKYLSSFINSIQEYGSTHYDKAFNAAFDLLMHSRPLSTEPDIDQVILFLTDGEPTDAAASDYDRKKMIMETIQDRNREMENEVIIMTYGLGDDVGLDFLQDIANQDGSKYGVPPDDNVKPGQYVHVSDPNNLRSLMASYYDYFSDESHSGQPIFSVPYQAASGIGLVTTVALPVRHNGELKGVVGVDLTLTDLTSDVTYYGDSQLSYPFVFDSQTKAVGRTLMHPLLPIPTVTDTNNVFIHITSLERENEFEQYVFNRAAMSSAKEGSVSYPSKRYLPRGDSEHEGVKVIEVPTTVYWTKITDSPFVVAIAIAEGDDHIDLKYQAPSGNDFLYHRIDLVPPGSLCQHFQRQATTEQSVVKFGPEAFLDPVQYLEMEEHEFAVHAYTSYMNDVTGLQVNQYFLDGIRDIVVATAKVDDLWLNDESGVGAYTVLRYIGTESGVFRQYPGLVLNKHYDPARRPWYSRAKSNKDLITLSAPYPMGSEYIITLSHTLIIGNLSMHASSDEVVAVTGLDFTLSYFYRLLTLSYPECFDERYRCFVIDNSGYFVVHRDFFPKTNKTDIYESHITRREPDIAQDLIDKGFLVKKNCLNLQEIQITYFYQVDINNTNGVVNNIKSKDPCRRYQLMTIPNTNAFLGIIEKSGDCKSRAPCPCNKDSCITTSAMDCECPCVSTKNVKYDYCRGEFKLTSADPPPCPPSVQTMTTMVSEVRTKVKRTNVLLPCFDPECRQRDSYSDCFGVVSCAWCNADKNGEIENPYCIHINEFRQDSCMYIPEEVTIAPQPVTDKRYDEQTGGGLSSGAIIGIILATIAFITILVIVGKKVFPILKEKRAERKRGTGTLNTDVSYSAAPSAPPPPSAPLQSNPIYINMPRTPDPVVMFSIPRNDVASDIRYDTGISQAAPTAFPDTDVDSDHPDDPTDTNTEADDNGANTQDEDENTTTNAHDNNDQTGTGNTQEEPVHGQSENEGESSSSSDDSDSSHGGDGQESGDLADDSVLEPLQSGSTD